MGQERIDIVVREDGSRVVRRNLDDIASSGSRAASTVDTLKKSLMGLNSILAAAGVGFGISKLIGYADAWTNINSQIKLVTTSTQQFVRVQTSLFDMAQRTRTALSETVSLYATIKKSTESMNTTDEQRLRVTETINKAIVVSGTAAASAKAALVQLGQGLGSGVLRGEELNSVLEQTPRLAEAIAAGMGKSRDQLRALGAAGKLTSEQVFGALANQSEAIDKEFAKMATTVSQSLTVAETALIKFTGTTSDANGAAQGLAQTIIFLSNHLNEVVAILSGFAALKIAEFFINSAIAVYQKVTALTQLVATTIAERNALIAAAQAEVVATNATLANLEATQAAIIVSREEQIARMALANSTIAAVQAEIALTDANIAAARSAQAAATAAGAQSFAIRTLTLTTRELAVAEATRRGLVADLAIAQSALAASTTELAILGQQQARVSAATAVATGAQAAATTGLATATTGAAGAATLLTRAIGFLGGPIGIITTLLSLGVTAWMLWGGEAKKQEEAVAETLQSKTEEIIADLDKQIAKLKERNELAAAGATDLAKGATPQDQQRLDILSRVRQVNTGLTNGKPNEWAGLDQSARTAITVSLMKDFNRLGDAMNKLSDEKKQFDNNMRGDKFKEFMKEYATVAEQRETEINKWKTALGDLYTPDVEKRIVDSFKDSNAKLDYKAALQALEDKQAREKEIMQQGLRDADALREQGLLSQSKYAEMELGVRLTEIDNLKDYTKKQLELSTGDENKQAREKYVGELQMLELRRVGIIKDANNAIDVLKSKEVDDENKRTNDLTNAIYRQVQGIQDQIDAYDKLPEVITATAIAEAEATRAMLMGEKGNEQAISAINQRIAALESLRGKQQQFSQLRLADQDTKAIGQDWVDLGQTISDALTGAFNKGGAAIGNVVTAMTEMQKRQRDIALDSKERLKAVAGDAVKTEKEQQRAAQETELARVSGYAKALGAAKEFFGESTVAYKALGAAEKAYRVYEIALALENFAIKTGLLTAFTVADKVAKDTATTTDQQFTNTSIVNSGLRAAADGIAAFAKTLASIPFPFNIAAGAVVLGLLAAVGVRIAGGGSGGGGATAAQVQKTQGTGSVFGDSSAKSDSINRSLELLKDNSDITLPLTQQMAASLRSIESSLKGVANLVVRTAGLTTGANITSISNSAPGQAIDFVSNFMTELSKGLLGPVVGGKIAEIGNKLWGSVKQNVVDAGIMFGGSVSALQAGQGYNQYATVDTTKKSWFGLSKKTTTSVETQGLSDELAQQFALIFKNLEDTLKVLGPTFGKSAESVMAAVRAVVIDETKVSLKDLKGDELTDALNAVVSKAMDQITQSVFPSLDAFRQVGEGYTETVVRVATGIESAQAALDKFNIAAISYTEIIDKQGDVETEIIRQSLQNSSTLTQGILDIVKVFNGSADELISTYAALTDAQRQLNNVGLKGGALDVNTIKGAGGLDVLQSSLQSYRENFFTEEEQQAMAMKDLTAQFTQFGVVVPKTKDELKALIEAADDGTASGNKLVGQLLSLTGAYAEATQATKAQQAAIDQAKDLQDQWNQLTMTSAEIRELERKEIAESNLAMYDRISALLKINTAMDVINDIASKEKSALQEKYQEETDAIKDQIDTVKAAMDKANELHQALEATLKTNVIGGDKGNRAFAQAQIESVLAIVRAGGPLPEAESIKDSLATLSKTSTAGFSSDLEYRLDYYRTRNNLLELNAKAGGKVDVQQAQLDALNSQNEQLKDQYDREIKAIDSLVEDAQREVNLLAGIKDNTKSTIEAIASLFTAIAGLKGSPVEVGGSTGEQVTKTYATQINELYDTILKRPAEQFETDYWVDKLRTGTTLDEVSKAFYGSDEYKHLTGVPGYDQGGMFGGGLRVVGERGWELEATGASRIWNQDQIASAIGGGTDDELHEKIDRMIELLEANASAANRGADASENMYNTLDSSSKGGRPLGVLVKN